MSELGGVPDLADEGSCVSRFLEDALFIWMKPWRRRSATRVNAWQGHQRDNKHPCQSPALQGGGGWFSCDFYRDVGTLHRALSISSPMGCSRIQMMARGLLFFSHILTFAVTSTKSQSICTIATEWGSTGGKHVTAGRMATNIWPMAKKWGTNPPPPSHQHHLTRKVWSRHDSLLIEQVWNWISPRF